MHNFFKGFLVSLALLFLVGCHHNAHIRTQNPLSPSETVISGSYTSSPIGFGDINDNATLGIIGMRSEASLLRGLENGQELGVYAGIGLGAHVGFGSVLGLHYKKYKYLSPMERLVKIGGGLEINFNYSGTVFNSKTSIISTSSKNNPFYGGIHLIYAKSFGKLRLIGYHETLPYSIQSTGIGVTIGKERKFFIQKTSFQNQFDVSLLRDNRLTNNYYNDVSMYLLFSYSLGLNFFLPPSNLKKSFEPLPSIKKRETKSSSDTMSNTSTKLFDPETGEPIIKNRIIFDPETGEKIKKDSTEGDPDTDEIVE